MNSQRNSPPGIVARVLAVRGYRDRVARLTESRPYFSSDLSGAFVAGAHKVVRKDPLESAQLAHLARLVANELDDDDARVAALRVLGQANTQRGQHAAALASLATAQALTRDDTAEAELEALQLPSLVHLEQYDDAAEKAARCLAHFERTKNVSGMIRIHMASADLAFRRDDPRGALRHYARVRTLLPPDASRRMRAALASNTGNALCAANRFHAASRHFELARDLLQGEGCDHTLAQVLYNAAYVDVLRGRYQDALDKYAHVEPVFRKLGDNRHLAHVDLDCAEVHVHLNLYEEATRLALRAENRFHDLGLRKERAQAAQLAGRAAELGDDLAGAERNLRRAETEYRKLGLTERRLLCVAQRASLAERSGKLDRMRRLADRASAVARGRVNPLSTASVELMRARAELASHDATKALHRADAVRERHRRVHAPWLRIEANRIIGRAYAARKQTAEAILAYRRAIEEIERYRGGVPSNNHMASFLAGRSELYSEAVELLRESGHLELADTLEQRKAQPGTRPLRVLTEKRLRYVRERLNAVRQRILRGDFDRSGSGRAEQQAAALEQELARRLQDEKDTSSPGAQQ